MATETIVTAIAAAISAGMVETGKKAVGDAYDGLMSLIERRFGKDSKVAVAVKDLEAEPKSQGQRLILSERLTKVDADLDAELVAAAQALLALIRKLPQGEKTVQNAQGTGIAQASGEGAIATVTFSNGPKVSG